MKPPPTNAWNPLLNAGMTKEDPSARPAKIVCFAASQGYASVDEFLMATSRYEALSGHYVWVHACAFDIMSPPTFGLGSYTVRVESYMMKMKKQL